MVHKFANEDNWFDFIVRLVLDEMVVAMGLFAVVLLIRAVFAPAWLTALVNWAAAHAAQVVLGVFAVLFGSLILFIFVFAILSSLGINF